MILGNDILIFENGVAVAASRSCDSQSECEAREVSSPYSSKWRDYRDGRKGWSLNLNFLVGDIVDNLLHVGSRVHIMIGKRGDNVDYVEGDALCTSAKCTATRGNISQGSWSFLGCGELMPSPYLLCDVNGVYLKDFSGIQLRAARY